MRNLALISLLTLGILSACSSGDKPEERNTTAEEVSVAPTVVEPAPVEVLEFAPQSFITSIQARATGIEATMYSSGASFSVFDKTSVYSFTKMIALAAPKATSKNQIGHIMFLQDGENILLANVYDNGTDVYMKSEDSESGSVYYNILTDKVKGMFTDLKIQPNTN